jgi:hypothetical protein
MMHLRIIFSGIKPSRSGIKPSRSGIKPSRSGIKPYFYLMDYDVSTADAHNS